MTARLSNNGYLMLSKEATPGVPVAPTVGCPLYDESLSTSGNFQDISPAYGSKFATHSTLPGTRSHTGELTLMFEPNIAAHIFNGLLTKGTTTGTDPATHPFTLGADSASYSADISLGNIVKRFWGMKFSKVGINFEDNEGQAKVTASALGSFEGREIEALSGTGTGPYTITLKDPNRIFDGNPTKGLLVGDALAFYDVSAGTYILGNLSSVVNGTQFTCTTATALTGYGDGDAVHLSPVTPNFDNLQPFLWSKTRFHFAANAAAALSAAHLPVEPGSGWEVTHGFAEENGAPRSGSFDPASLDRVTGNISLNVKKLTDTPEDLIAFKNMDTSACVVRHFAGPSNEYELRLTYNAIVTDTPLGSVKSGDLVFSDLTYHPNMNQSDGQAFDVKVINAITTGL